jgi:hypothetical protein
MTRLPKPGMDDGRWGAILNSFLAIGHNDDGTLKGVQTARNVQDFGAVGDGSTDNTSAFSKALASIPSSGGVLYLPPGVYKTSTITLTDRSDVSIIGNGTASVIAPTSGSRGLLLRGCTRCHLGNLRIDGSVNGGSIGIEIAGNLDAKLFNLHIGNMTGDAIYVDGDNPAGTEIELYNVTCRDNRGYAYHYARTTMVDTGGMYLTNFRALYNTQGLGGIKIEARGNVAVPVFHVLMDVVTDNYPATAVSLHNVAHCRFSRLWVGGSSTDSMFLVDGDGYMIEVDGGYFTNKSKSGYNLSLNGTVNGVLLDNVDFDGSPAAHVHIGSSGANFFLGQYQIFGPSPLTDTVDHLYRRSRFMIQQGPMQFETGGADGFSTTIGIEDIRNPGKQKWLRNANGTFQILNTAFNNALLELQDSGQMRWNGGDWISRHLSGTISWTPGSMAPNSQVHTTVSVAGAALGDTVAVGFSLALPPGMLISGYVTDPNIVTVTLYNASGGTQTFASGTLRADVWQH